MPPRGKSYRSSWPNAISQPTADQFSFSFPEANPPFNDPTPDQYSLDPHHSYRDPYQRTSVSGYESMPDYLLNAPVDDPYDLDIDPNLPLPTEALAGLQGNDSFTIDDLTLDTAVHHDSPHMNFNTHPTLSHDTSFLHPSFRTHDIPWNPLQNPRDQLNMSSPQDNNGFRPPPAKRQRRGPRSAPATQAPSTPSVYPVPPEYQTPDYSQPSAYAFTPSTGRPGQDEAESILLRDVQSALGTSMIPNPASQSASQHSGPRPAPKSHKPPASKFPCTRCEPEADKFFKTTNDLDRHMRGVHGIFQKGDKVWRCKIEGCTCADKIWPRRDNFTSHLKRMHFKEDPLRAAAIVDDYLEIYDPETHGSLEVMMKAETRDNPRKRLASEPVEPETRIDSAVIPNTQISPSNLTSSITAPQHNFFHNEEGSSTLFTPTTGTTSVAHPDHHTHTNPSRGSRKRVRMSTSQRQLQTSPVAGSSKHGPVSRGARTEPGPGELPPAGATMRRLSSTRPSSQDLSSIGHGARGSGMVDLPSASTSQQHPSNISLDPNISTQRGSDTEKMLREMLKTLSPEGRRRVYDQVEQNEPPENDQDVYERSVSKTSIKKQADGDKKTLECKELIEKKGALKECTARFGTASELKKHKKRHQKRFGCTFDRCYSKFGTKWEWKRHEQSQHIQDEAWRCHNVHGFVPCQQLFSQKSEFEQHLHQHLERTNSKKIGEIIQNCHVPARWLGAYWCGHCRLVVSSRKPFGEEMIEERLEHVGNHIFNGIDSSDWVELAANGRTKGEMKQSEEGGSLRTESTPKTTHASVASSYDGHEDDVSETVQHDGSDVATALHQQSKGSRLGVLHGAHDSGPSSSHESRTEPIPTPPSANLPTPDPYLLADPLPEMGSGPSMLQHQSLRHSDVFFDQFAMQNHGLVRICCQCQNRSWTNFTDRCDYIACQHDYCPDCMVTIPPPGF